MHREKFKLKIFRSFCVFVNLLSYSTYSPLMNFNCPPLECRLKSVVYALMQCPSLQVTCHFVSSYTTYLISRNVRWTAIVKRNKEIKMASSLGASLHSGYNHPATRSWQSTNTEITSSNLIYPLFIS